MKAIGGYRCRLIARGGLAEPRGTRRRRSSARPCRSRADPVAGGHLREAESPLLSVSLGRASSFIVVVTPPKSRCRRNRKGNEDSPLSPHACGRARLDRLPA